MTSAKLRKWMLAIVTTSFVAGLLPTMTKCQETKEKQEAPAPRSKDGKKLFGTMDALRIARVSSPRISPDGERVAYLVTETKMEKDKPWKYITQMWVAPTAGPASAARQYTRGEEDVSEVKWSPDGKTLAFRMNAGEEKEKKSQVWFMYVDGGEAWQVTKHKSGVRSYEFSPDGKTLLLVATEPENEEKEKRTKSKDDAEVVDHDLKMARLWTWDIASSEEKPIAKGDFTISDPRWSPDGTHITFTSNPTPKADDFGNQTAWMLDVASGKQQRLADTADFTSSARWSPDGKWVAFLSSHGLATTQTNLFVVGADGGSAKKLTTGFELNAGDPMWGPDGKTVYFSAVDHEAMDVFSADAAAGGVRQVAAKPGMIDLTEISKNGKTAVGTWSDPEHPTEVFRGDLTFRDIQPLTNQNPWLSEYALGSTEVAKWKSSKDGMEINGIVTKPVDFDASKKYPFLLNPHGGPTGASLLTFNPSEQIMAANGYVVLEPNFRGSTGRGEKFASANHNDWGNGDYKDDMSGVQAMVDKGLADADRLGAFGWSYGGYMTMWIDTQTDRFKAISPGAGLPDLYSMYSQTDIHRYMRVFYSEKAPWDNFQEYWDHSPMKYIANVKTPTLILHGQADTRVPIPQAEEFYQALSERHVPVEYVTYPRENHGFNEPKHIQDRWQRYLVFFGKYLSNPAKTEPKEVLDRLSKDLP